MHLSLATQGYNFLTFNKIIQNSLALEGFVPKRGEGTG
jgi:hypothetical protein